MNKKYKYFLLPFSFLYGGILRLRNQLFDKKIFRSAKFDLPVICIGNLSVGGTGKSPMVEYIVSVLHQKYKVATLSRGYKRKTKGFFIAGENTKTSDIGDEPMQFYRKFPDITVAVDEDRVMGIPKILNDRPETEIIILDDAFQHRKVKAGFHILLTSYDDLYTEDILLPTGNLREPRQGAKRADIIVVTKCPENISEEKKKEIKLKINALEHQEVFFGRITYSESVRNNKDHIDLVTLKNKSFTLVTGIANPKPLVSYLTALGLQFEHLKFTDHHDFSASERDILKHKKLIITTEKDMMRLLPHFSESEFIYYLPIAMKFDRPLQFDTLVSRFVK